ncbi:hypothetical protein HCN44_004385 [Aphidius gifuensis]|uniref:BTB domain-containing protein n=1 Tax=Aphidius gifuensis TaxID=684658 RepID=A0A834XZ36_APHGI|nr:uncharacterized protein LOC122848680 [Aphidius gifuensis]XP_044002852.1 uncharacterized protein LOC122848680 [Aphidius gifuensis]XP_044002853.1 uncharacterized protein LOC122848680 [Aphidius gifuensis]KAF7994913.1 hypothetical protein HCN44_004385 [Aphidius gifuensis]
MAGGTCTDKPGIFDNVKEEWSYHRQCQFKNKLDNKLLSDTFYKRRKVEYKRTCTRNISLFQKNIFRILTGCFNSDLYIIHDTNVIKTNCCIFKTRSPSLYNVLEYFFVKNGKPIKCYLNTVQAFQRIDNFVRLLYINTDISSEEKTLLKFFSNEKNCIKSELIKSDENDVSTSSLEMADSGLETGSLSLNENTESENSGTDIEESHVSDYIPTDDGFIRLNCNADKLNDKNILTKENKCIDSKACGSSSLMARQFDQKYLSGNNGDDEDEEEEITTCDNVDDVARYENEVLNDIFYESDGNDNEQSASFVQTGSFEFIEPENLSSSMPIGATKKNTTTVDLSKEFISENNYQDEKTSAIPQTRSMIVENIQHELSHSNDNSLNKSSSSVNNYYFIDASSLNDETEVASITSTSQQPIYMESLNYIPSKSQNSNDQMNKIISRSSSSHQCGHDEIAEFQRELKLTETLEPLVEQRKVKRVDSITDDKKIEKELLVVEIKEADSGESNHPSPCIDNNKRLQQCENNSNIINENTNDSRRSSLIRGNTFELEPGDKKLTNARQEHERRQGNLVFSNSIPQYSGHRVDGDSVSDRTSNYSSMSSYFPHDASSSSNNSIDKLKYQRTNHHDFMSYDGNLNNFNDPKYPMIKSASDKLLVDCTEINDNTIGDCMSLPMTFDDHSHFGSIKKTKCDETTPIVSGGVCTNDYSQSVIDSPVILRRKTESTPIVSGGSIIMTPSPPPTTTATSSTQDKIKSINRLSSSMTAWVVDMSDCTKTNEKSNPTSPNMSKSLSTNESCSSSSKQINHTKTPDKPNSLGFFINLNDIDKPSMSKTTVTTTKKDQNFINKQSFFIDLSSSNNDDKKIKKYQNNISNDCGKLQHDKNEKKNIFSMFIDLNDTKGVKSNEREIKSLNSLHQGHRSITDDDIGKSDSSKELRSSTDKKGVFMFIESDSPVVRRRTLSTSRPAFKRHSWNMEKSHQQITTTNGNSNGNSNGNGNGHINRDTIFRREHKRAHSVSIDPDIHMKLTAKKSDSSMSLNNIGKTNSLNIPETSQEAIQSELNNDQIYYEIRDTPPNSHIEIINDDLRGRVMNQEYKELVRSDCMYSSTDASCDAKILDDERSDISMWEKTPTESTDCHTRKSETFDISSGGGSGPSPESDNNDFDLIEYHSDIINQVDQLHTTKISETHKSLTEKIKKIECEFDDDKLKIMSKSDNTKDKKQQASCSGFVRLSDLDKTPTDDSIKATTATTTTTTTNNRMSKSIPETSWIESKLAVNRTIIGPCQIRTLSSRKYSTIMSTSLPAKNNKSPTDEFTSSALSGGGGGGNEMPSESDLSSMQSSMAKSCASTEETETSSIIATKPYNRLGEDLLRMFIEEINPDVTIDVGGRRIRAHKCILSSRCQYFAAILSGSWIENAGNVITLKGYSYNSVHFALCHIYSGESNIPDTISIVELATLADMLCLEGLKEIIGYTLKVKYCHLFHKPCQICTVGVLECMPLAAAYGLDEVYRKSLRWITRHFVRIWPCKAFASLPKELMDKCYQQHIVHMSADNILQTIMDCDKLLATLPNVRWAEPVFRMVSNLLEIALKYLSDNFSSILGNDNFQALGRDLTWNISRLEDNILSCADKLLPDQACKSYSRISKMISSIPSDDSIIKPQWNFLFIELLKKIKIRVEKCLIKDAARAARTTTWLKMDLELRRKIQELACLVILPNETIKRPTRHSNFMKDIKTPPNRTSASRSLDLRRVKMTITDQVDLKTTTTTTTKSNISQIKNIMTKPKTDPLERKMQTTKIGQTIEANIRPKSWPNKLEVKSRYLEPRTKSVPKENPSDKTIVQQRRKNLISSSDSSRTSSPAMKRAVAAAVAVGVAVNANKKPITRLKMSIKKDVKALSTDSLTETSTNNKSKKKDTLSKSCGITRPESPSLKSKNSTIDIDISTDSLADIKKKPITTTRKNGKMDNSISADSLDQHKTPKTNIAIKKSPILNKTATTTTTTGGKSQILERTKKSLSSSPPINQKNPLSLTTKRPARSVESSTAASRNRAAATTTIYHGSPSLRRSLLDAAKTPDIPSKNSNGISSKINSRQSTPSTSTPTSIKKDIFNPPRSESPNKKSPKLNGTTTSTTTRPTRPINAGKKTLKGIEDKLKNKCLVAETLGSRSGTFLKDEPTVLKKSDMKSTQVTT